MHLLKKLLFLAAASPLVAVAAEPRPNVVLILADDLGYGDVRPLNPGSEIPTPAFDRLAAEGVTFTDAHTPSAVCTPTRYGLLCGRYCWRTRLKRGVLSGFSPPLIEPGQQTLASVLRDAGYHTEVVGKWHLGMGWHWTVPVPEDVDQLDFYAPEGAIDFSKPVQGGAGAAGFMQGLLVPGSLDMGPYVTVKNGVVEELPEVPVERGSFPGFVRSGVRSRGFDFVGAMDQLTAAAASAVAEGARREKPFFLYFPLTAPHKPVLPHPRFRGKSGLGPYGDFIMQVDWTVGEVLAALDAAGAAEDTLVIVTSDNGSFMVRKEAGAADHTGDETLACYAGDRHRANGPFRGTKADIYEGGHRMPFFVRWPGSLPAGEREESTLCLTDVLATVAEVAGAAFDPVASPDSFPFLPLGRGGRPPVVHHSSRGHFAVRDGRWKLVLSSGSGGREKPAGKRFARPYQLYDLVEDPGETRDLSAVHPAKVEALEAVLSGLRGSRPASP